MFRSVLHPHYWPWYNFSLNNTMDFNCLRKIRKEERIKEQRIKIVWKLKCWGNMGHGGARDQVKNNYFGVSIEGGSGINNIPKCRYNVAQWLRLKSRADQVLHPQHEVLCEVAKWLLPVLCRAPNQTLADFPRQLVHTKVTFLSPIFSNILNWIHWAMPLNLVLLDSVEVCSCIAVFYVQILPACPVLGQQLNSGRFSSSAGSHQDCSFPFISLSEVWKVCQYSLWLVFRITVEAA